MILNDGGNEVMGSNDEVMQMKKYRKLYDSFETKDMPFEEFVREMRGMSDPAKMRLDLEDIALAKQTGAMSKAHIDRAIRLARN